MNLNYSYLERLDTRLFILNHQIILISIWVYKTGLDENHIPFGYLEWLEPKDCEKKQGSQAQILKSHAQKQSNTEILKIPLPQFFFKLKIFIHILRHIYAFFWNQPQHEAMSWLCCIMLYYSAFLKIM